ncbi:alpha-(1-_3)-arabinofuranosyltransferase [Nocardioides flavus (ex Wang et al. 2016)]|uniref:Alpha-(1->3)-arabinofuranosyltransferase n=1 Tax=Nocardioides flavus (ex Wang et al. 2016) TaxID=2058780 RepID=A0ABQ3HP19_9ACTN|nr:alpha-(1->3)-arabinofuranosyltransferase family protein [Nocardioides flavus (ex Wang et al. 2016)]GHE18412.1 alpha-(1->3)-arabinofuranosyltransferase [Nocardioides flavus (ex Wang et al. 2016)]
MTPTPAQEQPSPVTWRFRLSVCCLLLVALAFAQRPGRLVSDTKFDLVADPAAMLARSLHMWDPTGGFGQVQNQAYGYLFPMGPFFWLGDLASVPAWAVQRGWWSLLLVVAFLGVVKLCAVLGLGTPTTRLVAGFAYALSPRILTTLGPISIEAWPMALAPWVLVPLVVGCRRGSPRRAAALSALAVAAVGGVNAAATAAVLPLGVVWLLTRAPGPRRRTLLVWWPSLVVVGTLWWLVPLLLLGSYSPPFLDFIETAAVTTFPTTPFDVLRGTSHWVPYVDPIWQAGNDLLTTGYVAVNGAVLLVLGFVGLSLRSNPHRRFLVLGLLGGLVLVSLGHSGSVQGWLATTERSWLDGALAPLRNVHKFEPVVRLPLVLGLAHVLGAAAAALTRPAPGRTAWRERLEDGQRVAYAGLLVLATVAVAGVATPALAGRLAPSQDFDSVPGYWERTVAWLEREGAEDPDRGTALLVPGSSFATYLWGTTEDEPVQAYGVSGWAVRNAVPLAPPGNIRMLDAVESRLATGRPSAGLAPFLARAGVGLLVVRNDLRPADDVPLPVLVHQALDGSPGITKVAEFGPELGGRVRVEADDGSTVVVEDGWRTAYPAVEVYEVAGARSAVVASDPPVVVGGPESLLDLLDAGLLGDEPAVLAADAADLTDGAPGRLLLTDGLRRREATFARVHDGRSATLESSDDGRRGAPARDYVRDDDARWETTARILGARSVDASGSRAFADTPGAVLPETLPYAAFDGRPGTQWESGRSRTGDAPWLEVVLEEPLDLAALTVVTGETGADRAPTIVVETDAGTSPEVRAPAGEAVTVPLPEGATTRLRITGADVAGSAGELAIAEVRADGLDVDRTLVLPEVPAEWGAPEHVLLAAGASRDACVRVDDDVRCADGRGRGDEDGGVIDRTVRLGTAADYGVALEVRPVAGDALTGLVTRNQLVNVAASSTAVDDARASAVAAIDGSTGTTWVAEAEDPAPTLGVNWIGERAVRGIRVALDRQAPAARATRVEVVHPGGRQLVRLDADGYAPLTPFRASRVQVRVVGVDETDTRSAGGSVTPLGVGVSELRLQGVGLLPLELSEVPVDIGCGFGPTLRVGEELLASSVTASPRQLFDGDQVPARACGPAIVPLAEGETRVVATPAPAFRPTTMTLSLPGAAAAGSGAAASLRSGGPVAATVDLETPGGVVALRQNVNPGWEARLPDGSTADPLVVDGWQQAWQVPEGVTSLDLRYAPDRTYRLALAAGAVLLVLLALGAALVRRRVPHPAPPAGTRVAVWVVPAAGVLALGLVGGWWGLACGVLGAAATTAARTRVAAPTVAWVATAPLVAAGVVYWWRPLGSADGWAGALTAPQLLVALALGALVVADADPLVQALRSRRAGRSTSR